MAVTLAKKPDGAEGKYRGFFIFPKGKYREIFDKRPKWKSSRIFDKRRKRKISIHVRDFPSKKTENIDDFSRDGKKDGKIYIYYVYINFPSLTVTGGSSRATAHARRLLPPTVTRKNFS
jgi:hypothetical protein